MSNIKDVGLSRQASLPFDSLPYPTRTICRHVHVTTKRKELDHILGEWGIVIIEIRVREVLLLFHFVSALSITNHQKQEKIEYTIKYQTEHFPNSPTVRISLSKTP